jgi:hypothetical protein
MLGSVIRRNVCQPPRPQSNGGFLFLVSLGLHQRNKFSGNEWKCHKNRRQHDPWHGEDDLEVVFRKPGSEQQVINFLGEVFKAQG